MGKHIQAGFIHIYIYSYRVCKGCTVCAYFKWNNSFLGHLLLPLSMGSARKKSQASTCNPVLLIEEFQDHPTYWRLARNIGICFEYRGVILPSSRQRTS